MAGGITHVIFAVWNDLYTWFGGGIISCILSLCISIGGGSVLGLGGNILLEIINYIFGLFGLG